MKKILTLLFWGLAITKLSAQTPTLFQNLYAGTSTNTGVTNIYYGTVHNNMLYFNMRDSAGSYSVYRTDGTVGGTLLLKVIPQVANFQEYNNEVYFGYVDVANGGSQLWKTDGSVAGTQLIKTFGGDAIAPNSFIVFNNKLYFTADTATTLQRRRLFVSDGTAAGTYILDPNLFEAGRDYAIINNKLIFTASAELDSPMKKEAYITDGTLAGTGMLKDINPGAPASNPSGFITYAGKVYFFANTATEGNELWVTDGTTAGTSIVTDLYAGTGNGLQYQLISCVYNNKLYFAGDNGTTGRELFETDGTAGGTQLIKDIAAGSTNSNLSGIVVVGGKMVLTANDGNSGFELWSSDGTATNTSLLMDINAGSGAGVYNISQRNVLCADRLYFDADNGNNNIEPWVTDGTAAGTVLLGEINPAIVNPGSVDYETVYRKMNGKVYFAAYEPGTGREMYTVDDTCTRSGLTSVALTSSFELYPNPARNMVTITLGEVQDATLTVYNILGNKMYSNKAVSGANTIEVSHLAIGMYTVVLQTATSRVMKKLVIN